MTPKTIALVEVGNDGHRTAYMCIFIKKMLELGHSIVCFIPNTSPIKQWVETNCIAHHRVEYCDYSFIWQYSHKHLPNAISSRLVVLRNLFIIRKILVLQKVDLLHINYLDRFFISAIPNWILDLIIPCKWLGLLIHSGFYRTVPSLKSNQIRFNNIDYNLSSNKCVGLAIHDEWIVDDIKKRVKKAVIIYPEIADLTSPNNQLKTPQTIMEKARGRCIVGAIGLETHKCGYEFLQLALQADINKYFFVFMGIYNDYVKRSYPPKIQSQFDDFFHRPPENTFIQLGHINEGEEYNSILCSFDIIYLVYKNFYNASNRLTKAAYFNRFIIASNHGMIGEDVKEYNLGEVVESSNIDEHLKAIEILKSKIDSKDFPKENWGKYYAKHSEEILSSRFKDVIDLI